MANTYAGGQFAFTALFLTAEGQPIVPVAGAVITCFYFDAGGNRIAFVPSVSMQAVANTPGRYVYTATIPDTVSVNSEVYGQMTCLDPETGASVVVEQTVTVITNAGTGVDGLRVSFVKPAGFQ